MMGYHWGLGVHLFFLSIFLVTTTYTCFGAQNSSVRCHERERLALLEFKHSVKDEFKMLSSWVGVDCCSWKGIRCDGATGRVVTLDLTGNYRDFYDINFENYLEEDNYLVGYHHFEGDYYLVGDKMNTCLAELKYMKHLDLSGNKFQGSRIPAFFGSFKHLNYLNLSNAGFGGIITHHIGNLSSLKVLDLGSSFALMVDDMAWISRLSSLEHLDLSEVDFSQAKKINMVLYMIPSLTYLSLSGCGFSNNLLLHLNSSKILPNIEHLDLSSNYFRGQLPHFFQNMTFLTFLDLSYNDLNLAWNFVNLLSMIPSVLELHLSSCWLQDAHFPPTRYNVSAHSNIRYLDLSGNSLEGRFPSVLMNMTSLRGLDLSKNILNSPIPFMPNLLKLDISDNNFEHTELVGIWRQCHLKELSLARNYLGDEMIGPSTNTSECSQYAFEMLDLDSNQLSGSIPQSLGRLTNLRVLRLMLNDLTGSIPESLGKLTNLRFLDLMLNNLTGSIPNALSKLRSLEVLNLAYNHLSGPIPTFHGKLTKLYLHENQFNSSIPKSLGTLTSLTRLLLQSNQLTGPIPTSIGRLASLQAFSVASNFLNGNIPVSVGQLSKLAFLDVSNNFLEGVVLEAHFANLLVVKYLDLSSNRNLIFNVSREWIPPFQSRTLSLGSCKIGDEFPQWLQTQRKLEKLVLSNCSLYGLLPTWLRKMPIMSYLDLSHNKLSGPLINLPFMYPTNGLEYEFNGYLFLQDNLFNGSIPKSIYRRTDLSLLDVSGNKLSGVLPNSLGDLSLLLWLKLNDNNFNGKLPQGLGDLSSLLVLDLGNNSFSGNIPKWIGETLTHLKVLRLHKNYFTRRIPRSLCKCSYLQILDVGHNNLTGSIPRCFGKLNGMVNVKDLDIRNGSSAFVENVSQVMKGMNLEYTKTLNLVFNMDLSSNKFTGEIPREITTLTLLVGLNLSHNHLSGGIPDSIGNMKALNSLDLSNNQFTGMIPPSIGALNFLSCMNLSHNNLSGRIPTGNQLQTLNDPSIYAGNTALCGAPLPNTCSNHEDPTTTTSKNKYEDDDEPDKWFYLSVMCGVATGFWGGIGVLLFMKQLRYKLFMFAEVAIDMIYIAVMVRISKMKRKGRDAT